MSGLFASIIQTFVLLFILLSGRKSADGLSYYVALECRPLLYGFCIFVCSHGQSKEDKHSKCTPQDLSIKNPNKELTIDEYIGLLRERGLSPREAEVAVQVNKGLSNAEIAEKLCITETSVKKHLSNIFAKLQVTRREQIRRIFDENE